MGQAGNLASRIVADFVMTVLWSTIVSTTGYFMSLLTPLHNDDDAIEIALILTIVVFQLILFGVLTEVLGGASFNPLSNISNFAAGVGNETLLSLIVRIPAQTAGMQLGAWLTWHYLVPDNHRHTLEGPGLKPGVDVILGATAEFSLVFILNSIVLWVLFGRPSSSIGFKAAVLMPSTILAILAGAFFTGPSMNPLFAFSWAYHHNRHTSLEHFLVYWAAPLAGAVLAGLVFRVLPKQKPDLDQKKTQ